MSTNIEIPEAQLESLGLTLPPAPDVKPVTANGIITRFERGHRLRRRALTG